MNINEVSKKFGLPKDTLRYWEKEGLIPAIKRDQNGYRVYSEYDQNWIFYILVLRKAGMPVKKLKQFVVLYLHEPQTRKKRRELLEMQRDELIKQTHDIQKTINYLTYKIDHFADQLLTFENEKLAYEKKVD